MEDKAPSPSQLGWRSSAIPTFVRGRGSQTRFGPSDSRTGKSIGSRRAKARPRRGMRHQVHRHEKFQIEHDPRSLRLPKNQTCEPRGGALVQKKKNRGPPCMFGYCCTAARSSDGESGQRPHTNTWWICLHGFTTTEDGTENPAIESGAKLSIA